MVVGPGLQRATRPSLVLRITLPKMASLIGDWRVKMVGVPHTSALRVGVLESIYAQGIKRRVAQG